MKRNKKKAEELEDLGWDALGSPELNLGGDTSAAEEYFRRALSYNPDLADAFNGLGTVFYRYQRFAEAEAMYRTALEKARADLGSDKPRAYTWWGDLYLPQVVLHGTAKPYNIWHGTNLAEPSYALDYWANYSSLWKTHSDAVAFLRLVYDDEDVRSEIRSFVEVKAKLLEEKDISARGPLVDEELRIQRWKRLQTTNSAIASRVLSGFRAG
jgi:tetratricopeptide (TPR) repeat protein